MQIGKLIIFIASSLLFIKCTTNSLKLQNEPQSPGEIIIRGYAQTDSLQIKANGENLMIDEEINFINSIEIDYQFVYFNFQPEILEVQFQETGEIIQTYEYSSEQLTDTLSFFYKPGLFIEDVLSFKPGTLSQSGYTGYRFIFPNMNAFSNSGYEGDLDGIIRKITGQELGIVENIGKENFSTFLEFPFGPPPILNMELVKHGTTESYIAGETVKVQLVMRNNKSSLIVLEEVADENGNLLEVKGQINLTDFFDYE